MKSGLIILFFSVTSVFGQTREKKYLGTPLIGYEGLLSGLKSSPDNTITVDATEDNFHLCLPQAVCNPTLAVICEFGGGRCSTFKTWTNNWVGGRFSRTNQKCKISISNCKDKPDFPEKTYEQVIAELKKDSISQFFVRNADDCSKKYYCNDKFNKDMVDLGDCTIFQRGRICTVQWGLRYKIPEFDNGKSKEEIFKKARTRSGAIFKVNDFSRDCSTKCKDHLDMCFETHYHGQCDQSGLVLPEFHVCEIRIHCLIRKRPADLNLKGRSSGQGSKGKQQNETESITAEQLNEGSVVHVPAPQLVAELNFEPVNV